MSLSRQMLTLNATKKCEAANSTFSSHHEKCIALINCLLSITISHEIDTLSLFIGITYLTFIQKESAYLTWIAVCTADLASDGTKRPCTPEKIKDKVKAELSGGDKEGDEGSSVVVKEEGSKDGADVKPSKEKLNAAEIAADSKPPGDKYSPKVSPVLLWCTVVCTWHTLTYLLLLPIRQLFLRRYTGSI